MVNYLNIGLIIISVLLIISVIMQSKGAGLGGGLTGADSGSVYTARRGVERTLFRVTIVLSVIFFALVITLVLIGK
jgi:preprotein translocase subunit SecG